MQLTRHPLNTHFEWRQPVWSDYQLISDAQARDYAEHGYFLLEAAFTQAEMDEVAAAIAPFEEATEAFLKTRENGTHTIARAGEITFSPHLVTRSKVLKTFSLHPVFRALTHDLIGPDVRLYWDQAVYKKPGTPDEFPWHQDNGYTFVEPQQYLTCWVALTDATEENGCPWVIPGIHRQGTLKHEWTPLGFRCIDQAEGAVAVPARAGSIVVFSSLTPHRTGPNLTNGIRKSYILQYAPDGAVMRRSETESLACDAEDRQYLVPNV